MYIQIEAGVITSVSIYTAYWKLHISITESEQITNIQIHN